MTGYEMVLRSRIGFHQLEKDMFSLMKDQIEMNKPAIDSKSQFQQTILNKFNRTKQNHLYLSIVLDLLGMATLLIPLLGEVADLVFAPLYGIVIFILYRRHLISAAIGGFSGFIEEILPGMDWVPTATLMWVYTYYIKKDSTFRRFVNNQDQERKIIDESINVASEHRSLNSHLNGSK